MTLERSRRLINGVWQYVTAPDGGGGPGSTPNLAAVLAEGADAGGAGITGLDDPTADQDAATKKYVDDNGGSVPVWDLHELSPLEADWALNGGVGTWTFVGGVISHTVADEDAVITCTAPLRLPSLEYVIEGEIRIPVGQDVATTVIAALIVGNNTPSDNGQFPNVADLVGAGPYLEGVAPGDGVDIVAQLANDGLQGTPDWPTEVVQGEWHTLRGDMGAMRQIVSLDGVVLFATEAISGGNDPQPTSTPPATCDATMLGAVGLADFRNIKVWTRALPA